MKSLAWIFTITLLSSSVFAQGTCTTAVEASEKDAPPVAILRAGDQLPTVEMKDFFKGETDPKWRPDYHRKIVTVYLTADQRKQYQVSFKDGVFLKADDSVLVDPGNLYNWVMDGNGNVYVFDQVGHSEIRHSSILDGGPVAAAGELTVDATGHLTALNFNSGHYPQPDESHQNALKEFNTLGIDFTNVKVFLEGGFPWTEKTFKAFFKPAA